MGGKKETENDCLRKTTIIPSLREREREREREKKKAVTTTAAKTVARFL